MFRRLLHVIFLLLLLPVLLLLGCQSRIIYYPQAYHVGNMRTLAKHRGERIEHATGQGRQVAHYIPARDGSSGTIWMCFAGNGMIL